MGNLEVIWSFLTGGIGGNVVFGLLIIAALLLVTLVFYAACALADVQAPSFIFSLLLVVLALCLCVPVIGGLVRGYQELSESSWLSGGLGVIILGISGFISCVCVSAAICVLILRTNIKKGLLAGFFGQVLSLLLFSLLYGALLIVLAVIQIVNKKPANQPNPAQATSAAQTSALLLP